MTSDPRLARATSARAVRRRVGVGILVASGAVLVLGMTMLGLKVAPMFGNDVFATSHTLPVDTTFSLDAGSWVVFEQTGAQRGGGPVTITTNRPVTLTADEVAVTDPSGRPVPTKGMTGNQTINRNGTIYTGAVHFRAATKGQYRIVISGGSAPVIIGEDIGTVFSSAVPWFLLTVLAVLGGLAGAALMLFRRRPKAGHVAAMQPGHLRAQAAAPGWYPDPRRAGEFLWWDGVQWRIPQAPNTTTTPSINP